MSSTCATCRYGRDEYTYNTGSQELKGRKCRFKAPVVTGGMMSSVETVWPIVQPDDFCGDWTYAHTDPRTDKPFGGEETPF